MTRAQQTLSILLLVSSVRGRFPLRIPSPILLLTPALNLALPRPIPGSRTSERNRPE
jgi:hypothetical protein